MKQQRQYTSIEMNIVLTSCITILLSTRQVKSFQLKHPRYTAVRCITSMTATKTSQHEPLNVAILGGGIAGLSCATHLLNSNGRVMSITLFDTGRLRPGGRCSSRLMNDEPAVFKNRSSGRVRCDDVDASNHSNDGNAVPTNVASIIRQQMNVSSSQDRIIATIPVDHAAQILSFPTNIASLRDDIDNNCFRNQVNKWLEDGVITTFPEKSVCELVAKDDKAATLHPIQGEMYYGKGGMASIPLAMRDYCLSCNNDENNIHSFQIMQDVWVSPSNGVKYIGNSDDNSPKWELKSGSKSYGSYHQLVIAHNGKCADRIMSKTPAKALHSLLRTKFAPSVPKWGGRDMTLNSIYSLVFAIKSDNKKSSSITQTLKTLFSQDVYTLMIRNEHNLRLLSSNTLKHSHAHHPSLSTNIEVYTLLSSPQFGKQYKGPQENLPNDLMEEVTMKLLQSLERALSITENEIVDHVVDLKLQLWGAAVPLNTWTTPNNDGFVYDSQFHVGACGDWILDSSIAGAWESGKRLASWIACEGCQSVGLPNLDGDDTDGKFLPSRAALESGIGTIPSTPNSKYEFPTSDRITSASFRSGGGRAGRPGTRGGRNITSKNGGGKKSTEKAAKL